MFRSIGRAISAHKEIVIVAMAIAFLAAYVLPPSNTAAVLPNVSVNTPKSYIHTFDGTIGVNTPGAKLENHPPGINK